MKATFGKPKTLREGMILVEPNLREKDIKGDIIWLFYRKVLKIRCFRPLSRTVDVFRVNDKLRSKTTILFKRERDGAVFRFNCSKTEPLSFSVIKGGKVYDSPQCLNTGEFEDAFKAYFRRRSPILPPGTGVLPDNKR